MRPHRLALLLPLLLMAASPDAHAAKVKLAVMDLKPLGVEATIASTYTELLASEINETGLFTVISRADIKSMLDFEEDRRLVGCTADAACMAEIGGALGVEYVVSGSVGLLGGKHMLNLQLLDINRAKVESRVKRTLPPGSEKGIQEEMRRAAAALVRPVRKGHTGFLLVDCSEEGAGVHIDDSLTGMTPLPQKSLSGGHHELLLRKKGFVEWASDVEIKPGEQTKVSVVLTPSREYIEGYERKARTMRLLAWSTLGLAVASAAGSTWFYLKAKDNAEISQDAVDQMNLQPGKDDPALRARADEANSEGETQYTLYWVLMGSAVASAGASALLFYLGDDPSRYETFAGEAPVTLGPGPGLGGISLTARF